MSQKHFSSNKFYLMPQFLTSAIQILLKHSYSIKHIYALKKVKQNFVAHYI